MNRITINGADLSLNYKKQIEMTEQQKSFEPELSTTQEGFIGQHALAQYIDVSYRLATCASVQLVASSNENVENNQFESSTKSIGHLKEGSGTGPEYIKLDVNSLMAVTFSDASFSDVPRMKSLLSLSYLSCIFRANQT